MSKVRVLIVHGRVLLRRVLADFLAGDPDVEVAGTAASGRIALAKIAQLKPDIIALDADLADGTGVDALSAIRQAHPGLPVVLVCGGTHRARVNAAESAKPRSGSSLARRASEGGADPSLARRANGLPDEPVVLAPPGDVEEAARGWRQELLARLKAGVLPRAGADRAAAGPVPTVRLPAAVGAGTPARVGVVAIGASTGGPPALGKLLSCLPADWPVPVLMVQHMPASFTKAFADRLTAQGSVPVQEAWSGVPLLPGEAWLAPGGLHLGLANDGQALRLHLHRGPRENSCRPSVDVLFRSVAEHYGPAALAVVLTGMGQDGLRGCECIRAAGGQVLVQDEATSVVWGMPGFVARAGLADRVLPLDQIGPEIVQRVLRAGRKP